MDAYTQENIWLTGASSGIGKDLVHKLAEQGHRVFISARNIDVLNDLADQYQNVHAIAFDVTDENQLDEVRSKLKNFTDSLDTVIINAGNCEYLDIHKPDWQMMRRIMDVNYFGMINTLAIAMDFLQANQRTAHIVGVASMATELAFPRAEAYGSSKAAMDYFLRSLRVDLSHDDIDVTVVKPGFVATPLTDKNDFAMPFKISSEEAADYIVSNLQKRPNEMVFPKKMQYLLNMLKIGNAWDRWIAPKSVAKS